MNPSFDDSIIILDEVVQEVPIKTHRQKALSGRNVTQNLTTKSNTDNEQTGSKTSDDASPFPILVLGKKRARDWDSIPVIEILSDDENINGEVTAPEVYSNGLSLNKKICPNFIPTGSGKLSEKFAQIKKKKKKSSRKTRRMSSVHKNSDRSKQICTSKGCDIFSAGGAIKVNDSSKVKLTESSSKLEQQSNKIVSSNETVTNLEVEILCTLPHPQPAPPHSQPPLLPPPPPPPHTLLSPILKNPHNTGLINFQPPPVTNFQFQPNIPIDNNYSQFNFSAFVNQCQPRGNLRPIAIDGSNVAFCHGMNKRFSCKGIKLCVDYFLKRGHSTVKAFVPQFRRNSSNRENVGTEILERLAAGQQYVVFTPTRKVRNKLIYPYDDRFILEYASQTGAIVVSNDNYRDLLNENVDFRVTIENRLLMYTFADDCFLVPQDPMGKNGPMLSQFLSF